jgi:hypothetical protein
MSGVERASMASTVAFGDVQMSGRVRAAAGTDGIDAAFDVIGA